MTDRLDAVVLCARHFRSSRTVTGEGFEATFALLYLSRFVLSYELLDLLGAAPRPVILNVAGPGSGVDAIGWDDLGGAHGYDGGRALAQGGQLNDLLGVEFAHQRAAPAVAYVLLHPGIVDTALSGDYDDADAAAVAELRTRARPVSEAVGPLLAVLDNPPHATLSAIRDDQSIDLTQATDPELAHRLFGLTTAMLAQFTSARPGVDRQRLRRLLDSPVFATVATLAADGAPHQSVVWVDREGEDIVFSVAVGSVKERNLRRDPRVNILVSPPSEPYTYAAVSGTATLAPDAAGATLDRLARKYTGTDYADHHEQAAARRAPMVIARVRPARIVGRL
ncbi:MULTISPECIES: TIGR03618 family F420-dependent PPOX class oxidoreductase [unclassified Pseudonocardia]|uniref:TIGR03618 family F420-dependent PPOX class oxidoreductase n=1 Tax=unclassified Pseudonocardia TaxID=2619320 RepID=UPI000A44C63A|nr:MULTISPECIES: TIGR03618 family F420-dependent PPOX class oxidoreductase [unclassified Pseudonocardia]